MFQWNHDPSSKRHIFIEIGKILRLRHINFDISSKWVMVLIKTNMELIIQNSIVNFREISY